MSKKYYVGSVNYSTHEVFTSAKTPTESSHGSRYIYVTGPFNTKGAAAIMATYGRGNPHLQSVYDAERMARHRPDMVRDAYEYLGI